MTSPFHTALRLDPYDIVRHTDPRGDYSRFVATARIDGWVIDVFEVSNLECRESVMGLVAHFETTARDRCHWVACDGLDWFNLVPCADLEEAESVAAELRVEAEKEMREVGWLDELDLWSGPGRSPFADPALWVHPDSQ